MHSLWMVLLLIPLSNIDLLSNELLQRRGRMEDEERAAFLVRRDDGTVALHHWPKSGFRSARWKGQLPAGVIGVMHTHPVRLPRPSGQDIAEARRLGLPFYVVSRRQLCVADAEGTVTCGAR
jgi:hypothetical protein